MKRNGYTRDRKSTTIFRIFEIENYTTMWHCDYCERLFLRKEKSSLCQSTRVVLLSSLYGRRQQCDSRWSRVAIGAAKGEMLSNCAEKKRNRRLDERSMSYKEKYLLPENVSRSTRAFHSSLIHTIYYFIFKFLNKRLPFSEKNNLIRSATESIN